MSLDFITWMSWRAGGQISFLEILYVFLILGLLLAVIKFIELMIQKSRNKKS